MIKLLMALLKLLFLSAVFVIAVAFLFRENIDSTQTTVEKISFDSYQKKINQFDYRKSLLEKYNEGSLFKINGKVAQIIVGNENALRINTAKDGYGDDIYIVLAEKPELLDGDKVTIYARYAGLYQYTTAFNVQRRIPKFWVDYYLGPQGAGNIPKEYFANIKSKKDKNPETTESNGSKSLEVNEKVKYENIDSLKLALEYAANPFEIRKKYLGKRYRTNILITQRIDEGTHARLINEAGFFCLMDSQTFTDFYAKGEHSPMVTGVLVESRGGIGLNNCKSE